MNEQTTPSGASEQSNLFTTLTANIVSSYVGSPANHVSPEAISELITSVFGSLSGLVQPVQETVRQEPAVSIRASVKPDFITCLEDGKKLKMLRRYLKTQFGMTPDQYRAKWGLPADYPMVAPNYTEQRRDLAKKIGLGTKRRSSTTEAAAPAPKRGRAKEAPAAPTNGRRRKNAA